MANVVDQFARDSAMHAIAMVEAHEQVCEERANASKQWRENTSQQLGNLSVSLTNEISKVSKSVSGLYNRIWYAVGSVILLLLSLVGYLVDKHGI